MTKRKTKGADGKFVKAPSVPEPKLSTVKDGPVCTVEVKVADDEPETVNHPAHYGGADDPYEAIKVVEAWELNFHLGNAVKYIRRAGCKGSYLEDLRKAAWYLQREIENTIKGERYEQDRN